MTAKTHNRKAKPKKPAPATGKACLEVAAITGHEDIAAHLAEFESSPAELTPQDDLAHLDRMLLDSPGKKPDIAASRAAKYDPTGKYGLRFALREIALHLVTTPALYDRITDPRQFKKLVADLRQSAKARTLERLAIDRTEKGKLPEEKPDDFLDALALAHCLMEGEDFTDCIQRIAVRSHLPADFDPFAPFLNQSSHHHLATFLDVYVRPAVEEALSTTRKATPATVAMIIERAAALSGRNWKLPQIPSPGGSWKEMHAAREIRKNVLKRLQGQIASCHPAKK